MSTANPKPFGVITKGMVWNAWKKVKANKGAGGVDGEGLKDFEKDLRNNLYKIWNRMASGSYFPPAIKGVPIPKKSGGERILGIPTVGDRVAQQVVKDYVEGKLEPMFHEDSYGYRPNKSALEAVGVLRKRCWKYNWALEYDIKGLFDNIDHELQMKALKHHLEDKWVLLYVKRWLTAPMEKSDGETVPGERGTPQGGVISPLLANLFLHYALDVHMVRNHPKCPFVRYADDGVVNCRYKEEAEEVRVSLEARLRAVGLEMHPDKTKIVYCGNREDVRRKENISFTFLGYTFRPRAAVRKTGSLFASFQPAISNEAKKAINRRWRKLGIRKRSDLTLQQIARYCNPIIGGWINYYGKYYPSELSRLLMIINGSLITWAKRTMKITYRQAYEWLKRFYKVNPKLFVHWKLVPLGDRV